MVLVDTSVWVSHLRQGNAGLEPLLDAASVVCHPYVVGELACGNLANRAEILTLLQALPMGVVAEPSEILDFIDTHRLMGIGLGYVDVHLLASALLTGVPLWTRDRRLDQASQVLGISY